MIQQKHLDLLLELDTDKNPHSGGDLLDHLNITGDSSPRSRTLP